VDETSWIDFHLPAEEIAPALAREGIRRAIAHLPEHVVANLQLLTTELVSNAVRYASPNVGDEVFVRIAADENIRVEVVDRGDLFVTRSPHEPIDDRTSGWGLDLVAAIAGSWGIAAEGVGKMVWFELSRE
jgi:anti-sigma regulatory factor (Ser/Thr protein kinase)